MVQLMVIHWGFRTRKSLFDLMACIWNKASPQTADSIIHFHRTSQIRELSQRKKWILVSVIIWRTQTNTPFSSAKQEVQTRGERPVLHNDKTEIVCTHKSLKYSSVGNNKPSINQKILAIKIFYKIWSYMSNQRRTTVTIFQQAFIQKIDYKISVHQKGTKN